MTARTRIAVGALALVTIAHWHAHVGYLRRLNTLAVPDVEIPAFERVNVEPAQSLHVLVVDGLGFDKAMEHPEIWTVAQRGTSRVLLADFPSYTHPSITSMATGRPPRYSGVRINGPKPLLPWDSVSKRAAEEGIGVHVEADGFRNFPKLLLLPEESPESERELVWSYYGAVDKAAHHSGTESEEYEAAREGAARRIADAVATLDSRSALVVVSDHGHRVAGGHGGAEPEARGALFLAFGKPFRRAVALPPAPMMDLAPTLTAALGIDPPRTTLGRPMLDAFGLTAPRDASESEAEAAAYRAAFARAARVRVAIAALALAIAAWLAVRASARAGLPLRARDLLPPAIFTLVFASLYTLWGYRITWSVPRSQPVYQSVTGAMALLSIAAALVYSRRERRTEEALAMSLAFGAVYVLSAAWVGPGTKWIAGPFASFLLLIAITVLFYPLLTYGIRALYAEKRGWRTTVLVTTLALVLFVSPFVLRFI